MELTFYGKKNITRKILDSSTNRFKKDVVSGEFVMFRTEFVRPGSLMIFQLRDSNNKILSVLPGGRYENSGYMVISPDKIYNTEEVNETKRQEIQKDLRSKNLGYLHTLGGSLEKKEGEDVPVVNELSYLVPYRSELMSKEEFINFAVDLAKKYDQSSVLIKMPGYFDDKAVWLDQNGNVDMKFSKIDILNAKENKERPFYTTFKQMENKPRPNSFSWIDSKPTKNKFYIGIRVHSGSTFDDHIASNQGLIFDAYK